MPERYLGKTLGKYRVEELIGTGGFAWVYRGYDPNLEIPVALKVLKPQFAGDPQFEERFRREASTAARLRHPNIVKIYEVGKDGDAVYFAMDFLPSGLANKLENTPYLAEEFVIKLGIDVARALGFAHREGVIHRDIKVDNILFDVHGNAVVADFGIARAVSGYTQQTGTNMVVGTPQYFAPEQARAKALDGRADIYSLGVSLYRASTGRLPFEGEDWYEIARAHVEDAPAPPRSINSAISPAFEQLLLRCLAKHVDDRPATGEQLADELAAVQANPHRVDRPKPSPGLSGIFLSPTETPTITSDALASGRRRRRRPSRLLRRVGVGLLTLSAIAAAGLLLLPRRTSVAAPVDPPRLPVGVLSLDARILDSLTQDSAADPIGAVIRGIERDSARARPSPQRASLRVTAPEGARLSVNGQDVGSASWSADTMNPGSYTVRASLAAIDGCSSAFDSRTVRLRPGTSERVELAVRTCGLLNITIRNRPLPSGLRFALTGGGVRQEGELPITSPLLLPVGDYTLRITAETGCASYESSVQVAADVVRGATIIMDCAVPAPQRRGATSGR